MLKGFELDSFRTTLKAHLSPASPIQSQEHLYGRSQQLQLIEQALCMSGRSVFIHGDRGVGKTSIAQTVACSYSNADPILIACTPQTTFSDIMESAVSQLRVTSTDGKSKSHEVTLGIPKVLSYVYASSAEPAERLKVSGLELNSAVAALLKVAENKKEEEVVVIDEFDRIGSEAERANFADFIKQVGDRSVPVRFVFCGVGGSLDELLGAHGSAYRYLQSVEVPRLGFEARFAIIDEAAKALGIAVQERHRFRIAAISDGFPHYIHLVCEKLFWEVFNDPIELEQPTNSHFQRAIRESVIGIEPHLKAAYEKAVMKDVYGYEETLWAMADHADLTRRTDDIYDSYIKLFTDEDKLERGKLTARLAKLKGSSCGNILSSTRPTYYHFRENIMRGYVRLRAEDQGYELASDFAAGASNFSSFRQVTARRRTKNVPAARWRTTDIPTD